jgi:ADP-ribose pyrophosphatase
VICQYKELIFNIETQSRPEKWSYQVGAHGMTRPLPTANCLKKPRMIEQRKVFSTPWFEVIAKKTNSGSWSEPYYSLQMADYVSVVALTKQQEILLVRQYRPAIETYTLELPSGHVELGESPEEAAKRELLEETGHLANKIEFLGCLAPDTGRLSNRLWCYFAPDVTPIQPKPSFEPGLELVVCSQADLLKSIAESKFDHALNLAVLLLASLQHKLQGLGGKMVNVTPEW